MRAALALALAFVAASAAADSRDAKRAEIRKMRSETLAKLYRAHRAAKAKIQNAYGYALFSNLGINLISSLSPPQAARALRTTTRAAATSS